MEEDDSISDESISLDTLASVRSLIINANTSDSMISSVFDFLTSLLSRDDSAILHHVLKLLTDLALQRKELAPLVFESVLTSLLRPQNSAAVEASHGRFAVESLAVLASISETIPRISKIDGEVFASICLEAPVSFRMWLLRNAERFNVSPSVLFTLCLGFSKDPYPYIRKAALDGLITVCVAGDFDHANAIEGCYTRAVELLADAEDSVRSSAVRAVSMWGKALITSKEEEISRRECTDAVFLKLCSVVRDMSVEVRVEVFKAFGKIGTSSERVILQTFSKKVLKDAKGKKPQNNVLIESSDVSAAAGIFIHGFEDEFYEVRKAAVASFHSISVNSIKLPDEAVYLLMDMLYDDYMVVRLKALEALNHIADLGNLKIQETYLPAFLDAIVDTSENVRLTARSILKLVKLPDLKLVNKCVDGILKSLEMYPQDESGILSTLFHFGLNHANFVVSMVKRFNEMLETASGNKSEFNSLQISASLMLIISSPLSNKQSITSIPPWAFSYSLSMLGKFSCALVDMMDQDTLLAYLAHCSIFSHSPEMEFKKGDIFLHAYRQPNSVLVGNPVVQPSTCIATESKTIASEAEPENRNRESNSVNLILMKIKTAWLLSQSGCSKEALLALRACKQELATLAAKSSVSDGALEFTCHYVHVIELLVQVWPHFERSRQITSRRSGELEPLMEEVETKLLDMRCRFTGMSTEESLVMELVIFTCLLRLYKSEICCRHSYMKKLSSTVSRLELQHEEQCTKPSDFITETKKSLQEIEDTTTTTVISCSRLLHLIKTFNCFSPEQFTFSSNIKCVSAELEVPDNGPYNPISFVAGLPVAIPCEITLLNVSKDICLWLRISRGDETCQFIHLEPNLYDAGDREEKRFMFNAVVYLTPRAVAFTVRISVGIECLFEDFCHKNRRYGPKHPVAYSCKEKEVHFSLLSRT
ncbi:unnamed protein product [Cochlearia groenlandica]